DLLQWRAIEWGCAEGMTKYSLGGAHAFLRKFGGKVLPTTRCRLDLSRFRRHAIGDWLTDQAQRARAFMPDQLFVVARPVPGLLDRPRAAACRKEHSQTATSERLPGFGQSMLLINENVIQLFQRCRKDGLRRTVT